MSINKKDIRIVSNGNMTSRNDVQNLKLSWNNESFVDGIMCGEGLLRDPAIFLSDNDHGSTNEYDTHHMKDRCELFVEYCRLSNAYGIKGGWECLDNYIRRGRNQPFKRKEQQYAGGDRDEEENQESMQIYIARQHLTWMLGKTGHGRTVRYRYINTQVHRRHTDLLKALNDARSLEELQRIAEVNLPKGLRSSDEYGSC